MKERKTPRGVWCHRHHSYLKSDQDAFRCPYHTKARFRSPPFGERQTCLRCWRLYFHFNPERPTNLVLRQFRRAIYVFGKRRQDSKTTDVRPHILLIRKMISKLEEENEMEFESTLEDTENRKDHFEEVEKVFIKGLKHFTHEEHARARIRGQKIATWDILKDMAIRRLRLVQEMIEHYDLRRAKECLRIAEEKGLSASPRPFTKNSLKNSLDLAKKLSETALDVIAAVEPAVGDVPEEARSHMRLALLSEYDYIEERYMEMWDKYALKLQELYPGREIKQSPKGSKA